MAIVEDYVVRDRSAAGLRAVTNTFRTAGFAIIAAGAGIVAGLTKAVSAASNLAEAQAKSEQVFKGSVDTVRTFARISSRAYGVSQRAAFEYTATLGQLIKNAGQTEQEAADMSVTLVKLAADLAAFNNVGVDEAFQRILAGLSGSSESLLKFGINATEAEVKAKALELGIWDGTGALTFQQKVLGRYAILLEQTADAQGESARSADRLTGVWSTLQAVFEDLQAHIGQYFEPVVTEALAHVNKWLDNIQYWFSQNKDPINAAVRSIGETASEWFGFFFNGVKILFEYLTSNKAAIIAVFALIGIAVAAALGPVGIAGLAIVGGIALFGRWKDRLDRLKLDVLTAGRAAALAASTVVVGLARVLIRGLSFLNLELPLFFAEMGLRAGEALINGIARILRGWRIPRIAIPTPFGDVEVWGGGSPFAGIGTVDFSGQRGFLRDLRADIGSGADRLQSHVGQLEGVLHREIGNRFDPALRQQRQTVINIDRFGSDEAAAGHLGLTLADYELLFGAR